MSGYTAMSEKLDPEEVKEIMERSLGRFPKLFSDTMVSSRSYRDAVMALLSYQIPRR